MADTWVIVSLVILSLIVILLNCFCLVVILKTPDLHRHSIYAVANLLLCHLLQGVFVMPAYIAKRFEIKDKSISGPVCDTFRLSYMITNYASCLTLLLMSADRLLAIKWPMVYKMSITTSRLMLAVAFLWVYVIVLCILPFFNSLGPSGSGCRYRPSKEWTIAMLSVNTIFPMLLIIAFYAVIFFTARCERQFGSVESQKAMAIRIAKISAAVIIAYLLCWGPSFVYYFLISVCPSCLSKSYFKSKDEKIVTFLMKFLTFFDGLFAPLIYCLGHRGFRKGIKNMKKYIVSSSQSAEDTTMLDKRVSSVTPKKDAKTQENGDKAESQE